jgi:hypothetical protein
MDGAQETIAVPAYTLTVLPGRFAVCQLPPTAPIPSWACSGDFYSITRTLDELSVICAQDLLPLDLPENLPVGREWVLLRVEGPFAFDVTGVVATLSGSLAQAGVVVLTVATYQTDYLLVKAEQLENAIGALTGSGHKVTH